MGLTDCLSLPLLVADTKRKFLPPRGRERENDQNCRRRLVSTYFLFSHEHYYCYSFTGNAKSNSETKLQKIAPKRKKETNESPLDPISHHWQLERGGGVARFVLSGFLGGCSIARGAAEEKAKKEFHLPFASTKKRGGEFRARRGEGEEA